MKAVFILLALTVAVLGQEEFQCPEVKPTGNFKYSQFEGQWYEIGHFRNSGPSVWNDQCFCSFSNVTADPLGQDEGDSIYSYVCNLEDPEGFYQIFDTLLFEMNPPGQFKQEVVPSPVFAPHDLTVVDMTEDYALVYRCGDYEIDISYTAQILSRTPTLDSAIVGKLQGMVKELKLNPENAEYVEISHGNCTYIA